MGMWFGLAETNRTGFLFVSFHFLQWKFWSRESWVDALVSGEERFLDLGKIFLPYSLSGGYLSISGLPWLQKVFSFWPFLYSGDSCCCFPAEQSPSAGLHRERVTPSVVTARRQRWGRGADSGALGCRWSWDVPRVNKMPAYRRQERTVVSGIVDFSNISFPASGCGVRMPDVFRSLILLQTVVVSFILFSLKPINKCKLRLIP